MDVQIVGVDQEFRRVATVKDEMALLESIPPNVTVNVQATAANDTDSGVGSRVVEFQVSAAARE